MVNILNPIRVLGGTRSQNDYKRNRGRDAMRQVAAKLGRTLSTIVTICFILVLAASLSPHAARAASYSAIVRSEEHTSELQSLMRISYAVFCLKHKNNTR